MGRETFSFNLEKVPDLLDIVAAYPRKYPFLLDSAARGPLGRFSILFRAGDQALSLHPDGALSGPGESNGFLERLREWYLSDAAPASGSPRWPFTGGWFVYLGYELAGEIEPVLELPDAEQDLPLALAVRCEAAVIIEHGEQDSAYLVAERPGLIEQMQGELGSVSSRQARAQAAVDHLQAEPAEEFKTAVKAIKEYLAGGDVFQVNLSRAWNGSFASEADAIEVYRRLKNSNPAPFAGLLRWGGETLMSSSPERLVEVRGELIQTRPIAGTYPRHSDRETDIALSRDMLAHPKERAEHIMLIDLERNDLGRVCRKGSVEVNELMVVESYAHVHHIVSNVRGRLEAGITPVDVIRAVFPGGTITGCPKVRCMQIIAELEQTGRGFYTGSMGYIGKDGQMDLNILIRSMLLKGRNVRLRTGAGIVADSEPDRELAETAAKAKGLVRALEAQDA